MKWLLRLFIGKQLSLEEALSSEFGFDAMTEVMQMCSDRRDIFSYVSHVTNVPEEQVVLRVATRMKLSSSTSLSIPNSIHLPSFFTRDLLLEAACLPVPGAEQPFYYCIDPVMSGEFIDGLDRWSPVLTSWSTLERAINELFEAENATENVNPLLKSVFELLTEYDAKQIELSLGGQDEIQYRLIRAGGEAGNGTIGSEASDMFASLLTASEESLSTQVTSLAAYLEKGEEWIAEVSQSRGTLKIAPKSYFQSIADAEFQANAGCEVSADDGLNEESQAQIEMQDVVLLVDDSEAFRSVMSRFLGRRNIECVALESGAEALELLKNGLYPSLIVSDMHMPFMNGLELVREIRQLEHLRDATILMLTSDSDPALEKELFEAGIDIFADKSSSSAVLIAKIERCLEKARNLKEAA